VLGTPGVREVGVELGQQPRPGLVGARAGDLGVGGGLAQRRLMHARRLDRVLKGQCFRCGQDHCYQCGTHSNLNPSMGSSCDALYAGYRPKTTPTKPENPNAMATMSGRIVVGHPTALAIAAPPMPKPMPSSPPSIDRVSASTRNC